MASSYMHFKELHLIDPLLRALEEEGYLHPTPIQERAIPHVLAGKDLLGCAQTGTGKTAAFALPILQRLSSVAGVRPSSPPIRVLVLSPTRELASQIGDSFAAYGRHLQLTNTVIFGGVGQDAQRQALRRGVDILVATPGRLLDLMQQGYVRLDRLEVFVLDEADRMLDMGFIHDVRKVISAIPSRRQTLFFSATMPADIRKLADAILTDPARVAVTPPATTVELVEQSVYFVEKADKRQLLEHVLADRGITRALVFTRTKHGADRVVEYLTKRGIRADAIHGNKSQNARERALGQFKEGRVRVLVATDIAARGIDIDAISHVINFELPNVPETYVHRIGRTARAGAPGIALSFCDTEEREYLVDIERLIRSQVSVVEGHPWPSTAAGRSRAAKAAQAGPTRRGEQPRGEHAPRRRPQRVRDPRAPAHNGEQRRQQTSSHQPPRAPAAPRDAGGGSVPGRSTGRGRVYRPAPKRY
jgi:ATP-dependent RNA helicase RhlE